MKGLVWMSRKYPPIWMLVAWPLCKSLPKTSDFLSDLPINILDQWLKCIEAKTSAWQPGNGGFTITLLLSEPCFLSGHVYFQVLKWQGTNVWDSSTLELWLVTVLLQHPGKSSILHVHNAGRQTSLFNTHCRELMDCDGKKEKQVSVFLNQILQFPTHLLVLMIKQPIYCFLLHFFMYITQRVK